MGRRTNDFQTIRSEGGLLPTDLLRRVLDPREKLEGTLPEDYSLPPGERLNEVITQSWNRLRKHWAEFRAAAANLPEGEPGTGLTNDKWSLPLLRELGFGLLPTSAGPEVGGRTYAINRFFGPVPVHLVGCGLSLDRRAAGVRGAAAANPHGLVQEFLNRSPDHLWAIVSNGLRLRILRDNQALSRQSFLEFDLEAMFAGEVYSDFVLLWLTAHATRFAPREGERPKTCWLEQWTKLAAEQGTRALGDLRGGVEKALQILGEGFTSHPKNASLRDALRTGQVPLADFHGQLLHVVYRLIFLFVAEDRTLDGVSVLHPPAPTEVGSLQMRADEERRHVPLRVAEPRTPYGPAHTPSPTTARERYAAHYSTTRLRELAGKIKGSRHGDLWRQLQLLAGALSGDAAFAAAREHLALPALGSFLWNPASTAALNDAELTNHDFLEALRLLAFTRQGKVLRPVDYKNLGAEELGGVYESLLALTPQISADGARFMFAEFAGNERKTSGSYYTPDSLVQCLLDSALNPVVEEVIKRKTGPEAEKAILALKICDPAVGSGHFLVGAAHRLARHLARVRAVVQGESEPSPLLYQQALRDVIGRCLYGVDLNPMAAELCRLSLWLEALEPGKPLSFLDHHIRVGNSLLGATPELIAAGLPDEAFTPIEGDDKKASAVLKKRNKAERKGLGPLFAEQEAETQARLQQAAAALEELPDDRPEDIRTKELAFRRHEETEKYRHKKRLADAWCAAFVIKKHFREPGRESSASGITQGHLSDLADGRVLPTELAAEVNQLTNQYQFFHWHLAFPEVFAKGGFDCVLGNPPWERTAFEAVPYFVSRAPLIAAAETTAKRESLVAALSESDPVLWRQYQTDLRQSDGSDAFYSRSGRFPFSSSGRTNTFALFAELSLTIANSRGRVGLVIPSALATDAPYAAFWGDIVENRCLISMFDFENGGVFFPNVHSSYKFSIFTFCPTKQAETTSRFGFFLENPLDTHSPDKTFVLRQQDVAAINPITKLLPVCRTVEDFVLLTVLHRRTRLLMAEASPWVGLTSSATSSDWSFNEDESPPPPGYVAMWEAKCIHQFNHRLSTYGETTRERKLEGEPVSFIRLVDARATIVTRYHIPEAVWLKHISNRQSFTSGTCGYRDVARSTDERTMIAAIVPFAGFMQPLNGVSHKTPAGLLRLVACLNSFALDFACRQKTPGTHVNVTICKQLPVVWDGERSGLVTRAISDPDSFVLHRALELTYAAWDLAPFVQDFGWSGPPFRWDEERRLLLRCELDAAFFHLYLSADERGDWRLADGETAEDLARLKQIFPIPRDAVAYIMDTFPIVRRKDEEKHGEYRTKRVILEVYDAMQESIRTDQPYETRLDPPPADPRCCHSPNLLGILAFGSLISDPGSEIGPEVVMRVRTRTPFPVEFGRYSGKTRGGAPTLVPHDLGKPVSAEILVLNETVSVSEARDMLWRRETRNIGTGRKYSDRTGPSSVRVREASHPSVRTVLYVDFDAEGKIDRPDPAELAKAAIESVGKAEPGMDGITYLIDAIAAGIETLLTPSYAVQILSQAGAGSLEEALRKLKSQ